MERVEWELKQGNWAPRCSSSVTGPANVIYNHGPFSCPSGQRLYGTFGCPPGVPEVEGCAGQKCTDLAGNLVHCVTGQVILTPESGWQAGICRPCPEPTPTPSPSASP